MNLLARLNRCAFHCRLTVILIGAVSVSAKAQWTVIDLHPTGEMESGAYAIGSGQQAGYVRVGPTVGHIRASVWSGAAASWVNLHPTGFDYSMAFGADAGQQVGESIVNGLSRASLWTGTAGSFVNLHPSGVNQSNAYGVHGGLQVGSTNIGYFRAALWSGTAASFVDLNPPPTADYTHTSEAYAVRSGRVVGHVVNVGGVISASLWPGASPAWINLHPVGNISSWAYGLDGVSQVGVVRVPNTSSHAALWSGTAASWVDLHPTAAGAINSRASDVEGNFQVGYAVLEGQQHASLWAGTAASWVDLHTFLPSGFVSSQATSITTDGINIYIAGFGYSNFTGRQGALIWVRPVPAFCAGDFNGDNVVTNADVPGFVAALLAGACPVPPATCPGDMNSDGVVNGADIAGFTAKLAAGGACP